MIRKLWERELSVIPVGNNKRPLINEWSKYCETMPTEEEIERWELVFPNSGIGLACGAASGIIALDIDREDADFLAVCPISPIIKVGAPGRETRFFKYNKDIKTQHYTGWDILSDKSQTVLPPSIHPGTGKPYFYKTPDTLENYDKADLPELKESQIEEMRKISNKDGSGIDGKTVELKGKFTHTDTSRCPHGSQARLKALCAALIEQEKSIDEAVNDLLRYDFDHHSPVGYFSDKTRSDFKGDAKTSALSFYSSILKSINSGRIKRSLPPHNPSKTPIIDVKDLINPVPIEERKMPECSGLIRDIQQTVLRISRSKQEDLALGASLAIMAAMTSNKFHIFGAPAITHLYIMNVARSGQGKGAGFHIASKLLGPGILEKHNLLGLRNYSSVPAFISTLPIQRSRLDMVDEFGSVIESFMKGTQLAKDTETLLSELYTDRGGHWKGHFTATAGWKGGCYAPAVTVYANIQEETLINKATKSMIDSGLLGRFLYFSGKFGAEYNFNFNDPIDVTDLANEINRVFPFYKLETVLPDGSVITDPGKVEPRREPLIFDVGLKEYRSMIDHEMYLIEDALAVDGKTSAASLLSRSVQIAERVAIINAVGCDRRTVTKDDLDFGLSVVKYSSRRSEDYLSNVSAGSNLERKIIWAKKSLKRISFLTHSKLLKNSHMDAGEFKKLIETMRQSEIIEEFIDQSNGAKCYRLTQ